VFCRSNYCLNVIQINQKLTRNKWRNLCTGAQHAVYLCWIMGPKMTCSKSRYSYCSSTYSLTVLYMFSKHYLRQVMKWVCLRSTCSLSVQNKGSKHDLRLLKNIVIWSSTCSLSVLNMGAKHDLRKVMKFVYFRSAVEPTSVEYGPQTWLVPTQEFRALELDLQHIYAEYGVETWLEQSDKNSWNGDRYEDHLCSFSAPNMTWDKSWTSCIGFRPTA